MPSADNKNPNHLFKFLQVGMRLTLTFEFGGGKKYNYAAAYLGHKDNGYLIIDVQARMLEEMTLRRLENADVIVRGVSNTELGHVVAFKTSVLMTTDKPGPLMFTRLPSSFVSKPVREHERYKLELPCEVDHQDNLYDCQLADFSVSGCGIQTNIEPEFQVGDRVFIKSGLSHYIGDDNKCTVANITKQSKGWLIGVKFETPLEMSTELKTQLLESSFESGLL